MQRPLSRFLSRRGWAEGSPLMRAAQAALVVLAAAGAPTPGAAQISSNGGPIAYSADNLEYLDEVRQLILIGNVDVTQDDARLQANRLTLFFQPNAAASISGVGSGDIDRIVADGDVHYIRPEQKARGDRAIYETRTDTVTFSGNVVVSSEESVIRGETLVLQVSDGRTVIKPSAKPGGRVQGVFRPRQPGARTPGAGQANPSPAPAQPAPKPGAAAGGR